MSSVFNPNYDMQAWLRTCEQEIIEPLEGKLTGTFPNWLQGTLLRNGPGSMKVGTDEYKHIFDGAALLHRFAIKEGKVTYQCRFLNSDTLKKNRAANSIVVTEFGTKSSPDPCNTIFDRISSFFNPLASLTDNALISVYPFGDQVYAMTEVTNVYEIDPTNLETLKKHNLFDSLIVCHTAHPQTMSNGDVYNIGLTLKKGLLKYVIVKFPQTEKGDMFNSAEVVTYVDSRWDFNPPYIHSFGITSNYFVIIEQPMTISAFNMLRSYLSNKAFASYLAWYDGYKTQILLVNRKTKKVIRYTTDAFFFMHTINCFELENKLVIDVCAYKDSKLIDAMYTDAIKSLKSNPNYGEWTAGRPKRLEIPLDAPSYIYIELKLIADVGIEFPRINYGFNGLPYRYFYGIGFEVHSKYAGCIIKIDTKTGEVKTWNERYANPSEPIFVPRPCSEEEDDGALLSAVVWDHDKYAVSLLVLCARDLTELARAHFTTPSHATKCFHGWFLPDSKPDSAGVFKP